MGTELSFISPTMMKVFEFFLGDPIKEYHEREVVRKTGVSKGSASEDIEASNKHGLVDTVREGQISYLQA